MKELICKLEQNESLEKDEWIQLITEQTPELSAFLFEKARSQAQKILWQPDLHPRTH